MHIDCLWLLYLRVGVAVVGDQESLQGCVWISCGSHTVTAGRADRAAPALHAPAGDGIRAAKL